MKKITIQIGAKTNPYFKVTYVVAFTTAPRAYDGFGTIELSAHDERSRYVLIREEHLAWQQGRYSSGIHACDTTDQVSHLDDATIIEILYQRLTQTPE